MFATIEAFAPAAFTLQDAQRLLYREARALDDRDWDAWLAFYATDVEFWVPSWDDNDQLIEDPQTEISLIWYGNKGGLEDRVFRIGTERSSATSLPEPRTSHNVSNVEILEQEGGHVRGTFTGYREGSLSGELEGDLFRFIWDQRKPHSHGHGYMQMTPDGTHLEGRWGYLKDDSDGGRWAADRDTSGF